MTLPFFGAGVVELPPEGFKRAKNSRKMHMVFFVHEGKVMVEIGAQGNGEVNQFAISKGGVWVVPRGKLSRLFLLPIPTHLLSWSLLRIRMRPAERAVTHRHTEPPTYRRQHAYRGCPWGGVYDALSKQDGMIVALHELLRDVVLRREPVPTRTRPAGPWLRATELSTLWQWQLSGVPGLDRGSGCLCLSCATLHAAGVVVHLNMVLDSRDLRADLVILNRK